MKRVTEKALEDLVERLNRLTDSPLTPYTRHEDGSMTANPGNYHLDLAYGGVCVQRMADKDGGATCPVYSGYVTKRECFDALHAFINGVQAGSVLNGDT